MPVVSRLFGNGLSIHKPLRIFLRHCHKEAVNVKWARPEKGWTKLNYDGSCKCETGKSSIGGIFRDHNASFLLGYAESIGQSSSTLAELAALVRGLEIVLENGWSNVWLEGDYKSMADIITRKKGVIKCAQANAHLARVKSMVPEIENCAFTHTYREGNRAADKFAQMGHKLTKPQVWRHVPPNEVLRIVNEDAEGKTFLRSKLIARG
ncbi:polynucleotidyl transferase [Striga asiatica]|uniref:Polynucleotidyl transferase n=1 Tax=Striga asiatica TaxID=4170 RepID=A0A5A7R8W3_STRAF|nr:polynucleotidyl transferase [Striga asiatica]